jgi:hypothetical protein
MADDLATEVAVIKAEVGHVVTIVGRIETKLDDGLDDHEKRLRGLEASSASPWAKVVAGLGVFVAAVIGVFVERP